MITLDVADLVVIAGQVLGIGPDAALTGSTCPRPRPPWPRQPRPREPRRNRATQPWPPPF
jgi:hypothetical protein